MTSTRREEINKVASWIRGKMNLRYFPVDVENVIETLGGDVGEIPPDAGEACIQKLGSDSFKILIDPKLVETRKRFTLAHELGHLFLHMGYQIDEAKWSKIDSYKDSPMFRRGFSEEEFEAHEFAGGFLMPKDDFKAFILANRKNDMVDIQKVADHFGVSEDAALTRGRWLKFFKWE